MKTIIIEDERPAARRLHRMLDDMNVTVLTTLHSVQEAVEYLSAHQQPDLVFLDIQLSDGLSFEIFDHVQLNSAIIFTTAYDEYALKAFKHNSIDYLLKPIDADELKQAIDKFEIYFQKKQSQRFTASANKISKVDLEKIANLLNNQKTAYKTRYTARVGEHIKLFNTSQIQLFYSENKGTYVNLPTGRNYLIDNKLEAVEQELHPDHFFRISRQAIVRIDAIETIVAYTNSRLKVKIDSFKEFDLIVSRERVKDFKAWLEGQQ